MAVWNTVQLSKIHPDRCDAEYFRKDYQENIEQLKSTGKTVLLGKLFNYINRGTQPSYNKLGNIKALRSVNVGFMNFNETRQEYVTEAFLENNDRGRVEKDDVLITSTGVGTLGRTSVWFKEEKAYCDGHITILRNGTIDPYCITAFLNSSFGLKQYDQNYRGSSGQIEIYPYDISKFIIPECLLLAQTDIGNQVRKGFQLQEQSKLLSKAAYHLLEKELELNKIHKEKSNIKVSTLSELSGARRIDAQCFKPEFLQYENLIQQKGNYVRLNKILSGISKGAQQRINKGGKYAYVSIKDISDVEIIPKGNVIAPFSLGRYEDLLLAVTGATIGKIGIVYRNKTISFSGDIVCLCVDKSQISPWYLLAVLSSPIGQTQFNRWITGSTNGHLSPLDIRKIIIPRINPVVEKEIENSLIKSLELKFSAEEFLSNAILKVEDLIKQAANQVND